MNPEIECPVCGSKDIQSENIEEKTLLPFGQSFTFTKPMYTCNECGEEGEFTEEGDENYLKALEVAKRESLGTIVEGLNSNGYSLAYMERALQLSQRTLSQWKSKGITSSGMALMRIVNTYPWILKVADANYDKGYADEVLVSEAAIVIGQFSKTQNIPVPDVQLSSSDQELELRMTWEKPTTMSGPASEFIDHSINYLVATVK
jgi:DNA-directed RNA polymerase subunit RPC12/RpoP